MTSIASTIDPDRLAPDAGNPAVRSVMRDEVVFCLPSTPLDAVAKLMADNDLTEIAVLLDQRVVGYVAAPDILLALVEGEIVLTGSDFAMRPPVTERQARDIVRTPALLVDEAQRIAEVVAVMRQQRRELAVVMHEDDSPVGMVTPREVADVLLGRRRANG